MKYQQFLDTIKNHMTAVLNSGQRIDIQPVTKNNGMVYDGLFIVDPIRNVTPTIYLNPYYHRYLNGVSMEDILDDILATYQNNLPKEDFDVSVFTDFSKAKERIVMKLINRGRNEALLENVPFIPYMDLAIVFVCNVSEFLDEYATILIHNSHLQLWNIEPEELYQIAMCNTPKYMPYTFESMDQLLERLSDQPIPSFEHLPMYILTNHIKVHGACCMVYPGLLGALAMTLDSDLFILPSSIHEVLILPEKTTITEYSIEQLEDMLHEVNETQLTDDEILGDHIYLYHKDTGIIDF